MIKIQTLDKKEKKSQPGEVLKESKEDKKEHKRIEKKSQEAEIA